MRNLELTGSGNQSRASSMPNISDQIDYDYDPPDETLRITMENGKTTIALHDGMELFDDFDDDEEDTTYGARTMSEDSDVRVYRVLVKQDTFVDNESLRTRSSLRKPNLSVSTPSLFEESLHSITSNSGSTKVGFVRKQKIKDIKEVRFPLNPATSPKHYPKHNDIISEQEDDSYSDSIGKSNQILRDHCKNKQSVRLMTF
jgi:hypothetical protein